MDSTFRFLGELVAGAIFIIICGFLIICMCLGAAEIINPNYDDNTTYKVQIKCDNYETYISYKYKSEDEIIDYVDDYDCKNIVVTNVEGDTVFLRK